MREAVVYADQPRGADVDSERDGTEDTSASAMSEEERPESFARRQGRSESVQVKILDPEELYKLGNPILTNMIVRRIDDIDKAIEYHVCAVDLTTHGDPEAERLTQLGFATTGDIGGSEKWKTWRGRWNHGGCRTLGYLIVGGTGGWVRLLTSTGRLSTSVSYIDRYQRLGEAADLDKSLEHFSRALALTPDGHPDLPRRHADLGVSYTHRYRRLGEAADLDRSLEHLSRALALTPDGHPDLPRRHADLGASYTDRYRRLGEAADLDSDRYRRLGEAADLDRSLEHFSQALALTPDGHPDLPRRHADLGVSYSDRYRRLGEAADLDRSLEHRSRALALTPDGHPDLPDRHADLGVSYTDRYRRLGEAADLDRSLEHYSRALALTPDAILTCHAGMLI
ncbi:hypothetical protein RHS01_07773 [Rhizoctonia solani]|uniref:Uncharacterized protein n=1 Tax=Rhizoctonia solani TaxID=456999 RepID=A0A8H7M2D7_9AGAM|nr:hypothetical protein RHS01_07773 [Rhizoctonia solani]